MEEFKIKENTFRVKQMNAIEMLAVKTQFNVDSVDQAIKFITVILERLEVKVKDTWFPCKEKGKEIYYPVGLQDDSETLSELMTEFFRRVIKPVFPKSDE